MILGLWPASALVSLKMFPGGPLGKYITAEPMFDLIFGSNIEYGKSAFYLWRPNIEDRGFFQLPSPNVEDR